MIPVAEVFLLCSIPSLTVGILIYGENPKHAINRLLLLFSVVLFYWGFTQFEYMNANDIQTTLLWMRLHSFWYLLPALALDFAIVYTNLRVRRLFRCLFVYCPAIFLSVFENVAISYHPTMMPWGWDYAYSGYFGYVELLWTILPTVLTLYILARKYLSAKSQNERIGLGYIFSGFSLPIIMGITTTVLQVLASIDLPDLTAPSAAVGFLLVWYGVVRHGSYILMANAAADDILSTMADALFLVNRTGEVVVSNKAASRLLGYDSSELFGRQLSTLTSEPVHLEALLGDSSTIFESYLKTKQGQIIPVSLSKSQILTKTGDLMGYVIICHDITVRKQSEKTLRESEDRYRRLFESSPVSLWEEDFSDVKKYLDELRERGVSDFRTHFIEHPEDVSKCSELVKIISVNQATLTLYKAKSVSEFLGGLNKFFTKESLDNFREEIVSLAEGKTRFENKFFNQTLAGDMKQISLIVTVVPGYEDTLGKVLVSVIDLTEHKLMEDSLRDSERRFRELTDMLPETVLEQDLNGNYTFMNPAGLKHSGYDKDDLKRGLNAFQLVAPEDHDALREGMRRILNGAPSKGQELTIVRKDGSRFPEIAYATPIVREGKPVGLRCVVVDITERKRMEEKLRSVGERLEYVIQSNPAVIYVGKPFPDLSDSYSTFQSKNTVSITGFESDEFVGEKGAAFWASRV
ncbi:MAG TPA: PAS domain S-box protein, partial [Terriglobales bacterium]|nr:PAS domain S-box protein [Terriglobales bacterium]